MGAIINQCTCVAEDIGKIIDAADNIQTFFFFLSSQYFYTYIFAQFISQLNLNVSAD